MLKINCLFRFSIAITRPKCKDTHHISIHISNYVAPKNISLSYVVVACGQLLAKCFLWIIAILATSQNWPPKKIKINTQRGFSQIWLQVKSKKVKESSHIFGDLLPTYCLLYMATSSFFPQNVVTLGRFFFFFGQVVKFRQRKHQW